MKKTLLLASVFVLAGTCIYAAGSSCVDCHTNAATIKSLFVPPLLPEAEGEG